MALVSKHAPKEPQEPHKPQPSDICRGKNSIGLLSNAEMKEFEYRYDEWLREFKKVEKAKEQLMQLRTFMITTVEEYLAEQVADLDTCAGIYGHLKGRCAPSSENRQIDSRRKYHKLCEGPKAQNFEKWADEWRAWYSRAEKLKLTDDSTGMPNALTNFDESMADNLAFGRFSTVDAMISAAMRRVRVKGARQKKTKSKSFVFASATLRSRAIRRGVRGNP